ncbi:alpha-1,4-glucan--maltose-1-phosphate maltosyltransferase [Kouleothrix sp.]|uniref:alpha-1,4-glucan--maltose-1-phosphate maltosyltransferase n=1 Tax=Kouleothrix sp. TaxID=2779161 RepID=UPI003918BA5B
MIEEQTLTAELIAPGAPNLDEGRSRVVIEGVTPAIDGGRFAIKRVAGEAVEVEADIFTDSHDALSAVLCYRADGDAEWAEAPMEPLVNDRWRGEFVAARVGRASYSVLAWVDHFKSWARDMAKRIAADSVTQVDLEIGARLAAAAQARAGGADAARLGTYVAALRAGARSLALEPELAALMARHAERRFATRSPELPLTVDRERAAFSAWYELFPRSTSPEPGRHGTFRDVEARLPYIAELGFDVLYLTPIHPIGHTFRKGKDNSPAAQPGEPGSPYAVGNEHGGHKSIHPELGTLDDFRSLVRAARELGIEIALDNAFQCSPDHPYVREHPDWFYVRPDGSIQYAENPPKKYQDVYPFNFESDDWRALWDELKSFFSFWAEQGVRIFRVDNPHTKAFGFWEWCIGELKREYPDLIFLSEAFTRPKVMYRLAKLGFSQSYTYFAWRTTKAELTEYMTELTQTPVREFFRPNFWPTTHDILTPQYYDGYRATFIARLALAATLTANYGIYGPAYELMLHTPVGAREEYIDNEKYELRVWDLDDPRSLRPLIARLNRIRRENPALQRDTSIRFHAVENNYVPNDQLIAYTKQSPDGRNVVLVVVNLDPVHVQSGWLRLPLADLGIGEGDRFYVHDMLSETRYAWAGEWNFVQLDPAQMPVHVFRLERPRDERSFDYYL